MIDQITGLSATSSSSGLTDSVSTTRYVSSPVMSDMSTDATNETSFSDMMASVSQDAIDKIKQGEAAAITGVDGKASVQEVVEAVMAAENSLQTAIAIRNKVVEAYQEISRMTI